MIQELQRVAPVKIRLLITKLRPAVLEALHGQTIDASKANTFGLSRTVNWKAKPY